MVQTSFLVHSFKIGIPETILFSLIKFQLRIDYLLQLFLMLLTTGIKIDPCQYPGSKYPDQNNKLINSLTNHSSERALLTTGTKFKIS